MRAMTWQLRLLAVGFGVFLLGACEVDQANDGESTDIEIGADTDSVAIDTATDMSIDVDSASVDVQ